MTTVANDLVCPITLELPWDPVTAEDGRVYERSAIEQHIATQGKNLKSPMTNAPMGKRLYPAPQIKNVIETLIASGVLTGDLVSKCNEKVNEKKYMEDVLKDAENGDAYAMYRVGDYYYDGTYGFKMDKRLAFSFYSKAHDAGNVSGTAMVGQCYFWGKGVKKSNSHGWFFLTLAAGKGSMYAGCRIARNFAFGLYGVEEDEKEAINWLRTVLEGDCAVKDLTQDDMEEARELLDQLTSADN